jgi:hypothetical protein
MIQVVRLERVARIKGERNWGESVWDRSFVMTD